MHQHRICAVEDDFIQSMTAWYNALCSGVDLFGLFSRSRKSSHSPRPSCQIKLALGPKLNSCHVASSCSLFSISHASGGPNTLCKGSAKLLFWLITSFSTASVLTPAATLSCSYLELLWLVWRIGLWLFSSSFQVMEVLATAWVCSLYSDHTLRVWLSSEALHVLQHCARLHRCLWCLKVLLLCSRRRRGHSESSHRFCREWAAMKLRMKLPVS